MITRRGFDTDLRRHFAGLVVAVSEQLVRLDGYAFVYDSYRNEYRRHVERRTRVISLVDANNLIFVIPQQVELDKLVYRMDERRHLIFTDGASFSLDINEFSGAN